jgi:6-phosphogluconolactonase
VQPRWHAIEIDAGVEGAAERYDARMRAEGHPAFVLLGMGDDGHTASLFPGSPALEETDRLVVAAEAGMEPYVPRVTMTLQAIAAAAHVVFLVTGGGKAARVPQAFAGPGMATVPASLARSAVGRTTAILDAAAASGLS